VHQVDQDGIGSAFQKILENPSYRKKAQELAREYEKYDAVRIADETIQQVLRGEYKFGE
jgi:UDP:flavonoid glycosyltransferase YjiC (YdhE family)